MFKERKPIKASNDTPEHAFLFCARSIACKFQGECLIRRKLTERGYSPPIIEEAIRRCYEDRFLDDGRLATIVAENMLSAGKGSGQLVRQKLKSLGVGEGDIEVALQQQSRVVDVIGALADRMRVKFPDYPMVQDHKERQRINSYFLRRGYSFSQIRSALENAFS